MRSHFALAVGLEGEDEVRLAFNTQALMYLYVDVFGCIWMFLDVWKSILAWSDISFHMRSHFALTAVGLEGEDEVRLPFNTAH